MNERRVANWRRAYPVRLEDEAKLIRDDRRVRHIALGMFALIVSIEIVVYIKFISAAALGFIAVVTLVIICLVPACRLIATNFRPRPIAIDRVESQYRSRREFPDDPLAALPHLPAHLGFEADGHPYGEDVGELAVVDGWLNFEGRRTSFSISAEEVGQRLRSVGRPRQTVFSLNIPGVQVSIRVTPLVAGPDAEEFIARWVHGPPARAGIAILPPLEPSAQPYRRSLFSRFRRYMAPGFCAVAGSCGGQLVSIALRAPFGWLFLTVPLSLGSLVYLFTRQRALLRLARAKGDAASLQASEAFTSPPDIEITGA